MFLNKGVNVLSLFDGMSCGRIALARSGIAVNEYYASEIDKHATIVSKDNWDNNHTGDVTEWREWDIDWSSIDLILAGSPCQGFSFAGKQLAFDDPRSALFFVFIDILNHVRTVNPDVKFMLENVKMKKEYLTVISEMTGVEPVFINSALVSAQNRQRYYWCNWDIEQPEDKGVLLADVLESDGNGFIKTHGEWKSRDEKSQCIDANYHKGVDNHGQRTMIRTKSKCLRVGGRGSPHDCKQNWDSPFNKNVSESLTHRKLTPLECERLQTVPDDYTRAVSNTQRYRMLGNGWTVDVIKHILDSSGLHA